MGPGPLTASVTREQKSTSSHVFNKLQGLSQNGLPRLTLIGDDFRARVPLLVQGRMRTPQDGELNPTELGRSKLRTDVIPKDALRPDRRRQRPGRKDATVWPVRRELRVPALEAFHDFVSDANRPLAFRGMRNPLRARNRCSGLGDVVALMLGEWYCAYASRFTRRRSSSSVVSSGTEQPGARMKRGPAACCAACHCSFIWAAVRVRNLTSSRPPMSTPE